MYCPSEDVSSVGLTNTDYSVATSLKRVGQDCAKEGGLEQEVDGPPGKIIRIPGSVNQLQIIKHAAGPS